MSNLFSRLTPGEHVVRLAVCVEDQEPARATLPVSVEGRGDLDDLIAPEPKFFENFAFLLGIGLAQKVSYGLMCLRSPAAASDGGARYTGRVWDLDRGALTPAGAERAAELIGNWESTRFLDAYGVQTGDENDVEAIYPRHVYTVL
ncbi:hypothetical protein OHB41_51845 [Streptomyces sp. NBC_01571]|uniref:hypothetical protein n=1 Tax=Streptomyces sp. NBC_01571 TaxID=2975883 RepID=UPI00224CDA22|nr:hypothetical protein [Streptomyces sp. NBC_01571]MCX4581454.1 hypothetical protein [Streptomyces sp. NBC_01571]